MAHAARAARLFRGELVRSALLVSGLAALAGDFALTLRIHRCETAVFGTATLLVALVT
jgi:hypothetical protein